MKQTMVRVFSSDNEDELSKGLGEFIKENNADVISVSHSTCWDHKHNYIIYSIAIVYNYTDPKVGTGGY